MNFTSYRRKCIRYAGRTGADRIKLFFADAERWVVMLKENFLFGIVFSLKKGL